MAEPPAQCSPAGACLRPSTDRVPASVTESTSVPMTIAVADSCPQEPCERVVPPEGASLLEAVDRQGGRVGHDVDLAVGDDRRRELRARRHGVGGGAIGGPQHLRETDLLLKVGRVRVNSGQLTLHSSCSQGYQLDVRVYLSGLEGPSSQQRQHFSLLTL